MESKYFTIENYPDDVYKAVGKITKAAQEWEQDYKKLTNMLSIPIKKINSSSLNKLNEALKKNNCITQKEYKDLKDVINTRNYINHTFFLEKFERSDLGCNYEEHLENLQTFLNASYHLIFEATDIINNKIDKLNGSTIMRPTIFD